MCGDLIPRATGLFCDSLLCSCDSKTSAEFPLTLSGRHLPALAVGEMVWAGVGLLFAPVIVLCDML